MLLLETAVASLIERLAFITTILDFSYIFKYFRPAKPLNTVSCTFLWKILTKNATKCRVCSFCIFFFILSSFESF